jgi:hypothetical protein
MRSAYPVLRGLLMALLIGTGCYLPVGAQIASSGHGKSEWVHYNSQGKLVYKTLKRGDRIIDFSYAGYMGGGVAIPSPPVRITLGPTTGDNAAAIQNAIDKVSKMPVVDGFRGAVLLKPGTYNCERTLRIAASGVVLRGSGPGQDGTVINMTGTPHLCIAVRGNPSVKAVGKPTIISDAYVPSGAMAFKVADPSGFAAGDTILITRPVTQVWVAFMGMDKLVRNGKKQTWINGTIKTERIIRKIHGHTFTIDVPITDSYDAKYTAPSGVTITKVTTSDIVSQVGIENFRIFSPAQSGTINKRHDRAFSMRGVADGWARNIAIFNTVNSVSVTGKKITVDNVTIKHAVPTTGAAKPADINGSGHQLLFNRCHITGSNMFFFSTGAKVSGPIVVLNCLFQDSGWIQPHQRWTTGVLIDHCKVPDGGIDFMNRGEYGSGHGWAVGWSVAWNCEAETLLNQRPPGSANWMIGCTGEKRRKSMPFNKSPLVPEGIYDGYGTHVTPSSLYLAQLKERLGEQALKNTGY